MAKKSRKYGKRKTHHHRKPGRRKRRMSGSSLQVIGRRKSHRVGHGHHHMGKRGKRRRIGARGETGFGEWAKLILGTGVGLTVAEVISVPLEPAIGTPGLAVTKLLASGATYAISVGPLKNEAFTKGLSIGFAGSAINDGIRTLRGAGVINGPGDMVIEIRDLNSSKKESPANEQKQVSGRELSVIGSNERMVYSAVPMHG